MNPDFAQQPARTPRHVVISAWGSTGDVVPLIGIGAELRRRGHCVTFAGNPYFQKQVRTANLTFIPIGAVADHERLMSDPGVFGSSRRTWDEIYADYYYPHMAAYHEAAVEAIASNPAAAIVGDETGAVCAAELRGIARVRVTPSSVRFASRVDPPHPATILPRWKRWMAGSAAGMVLWYRLHYARGGFIRWPTRPPVGNDHPVVRFRRQLGLPAHAPPARLVVGLWPDWFSPPQRDWPQGTVTTGFPLYPPPAGGFGAGLPVDGRTRLPIVATTGSVAGSQTTFYEAVVAACRAVMRDGVLVTPHADHIPRELPAGITHLEHAPFNELFARAALVVHHGGIGTASYALATGVPQVVVPMRGDQYDNGNRLVRLGVARMLTLDGGVAPFIRAVRELLESPRVAAKCREWRARVDPDAGLRRAGDAIEALFG